MFDANGQTIDETHPDAGAAGRTIELIGPPASGKTTLALGVAADLQGHDIPVRLLVSARPGEVPGAPSANGAEGARAFMASRAAKLADVLFGNARQDPVADALLKLLPIDGSLRELRRRRYLASLAASAGEGLALRDQGYICAVAGLALDSGRTDEEILAEALRLVPLPDITVRIEVAPSVTRARLEERLSGQGRVYRFLERSPDANPGLASVFDTIEGLLEGSGRRVLRVSGACRDDLEAGVAAIRMVALEGSRPFAPGAATR